MGRGGYRCHPHVSAELQFEWLDKFEGGSIVETGMTPVSGDPPVEDTLRNFDLELETLVFTSNAKGYLLTGRYQPFVLAGVGFMRMESKSRDVTVDADTDLCPEPGPCRAGQARLIGS